MTAGLPLNSHQQLRLSSRQQQAVDSNAPALTIIAGDGTGKTEVISQRVQRILSQSPYEEFKILALSYTVRAAEELKARLQSRLESPLELKRNGGLQGRGGLQTLSRLQRRVVTDTIHGFALNVLLNHGTRISLPIEPEILNRDEDRQELLSSWMERNGYRALQDPARTLRRFDLERAQQMEHHQQLERVQQRAQQSESYYSPSGYYEPHSVNHKENSEHHGEYLQQFEPPHLDMWRDALAESGALDYPAIIECGTELLDIPNIQRIYAAQYRHVIIDEAQNLTRSQYRFITALIGHPHTAHINTVLAGDERQSIVGFAGADHKLIAEFEKHYCAERLELDRNFRSAELIDGIARSVSRSLELPQALELLQYPHVTPIQFPAKGRILVEEHESEAAEGISVAKWVQNLLQNGLPHDAVAPDERTSVSPDQIAVLSRCAAALRYTQDALERLGVPHTVASTQDDWVVTPTAQAIVKFIAFKSAPHHLSTLKRLRRICENSNFDATECNRRSSVRSAGRSINDTSDTTSDTSDTEKLLDITGLDVTELFANSPDPAVAALAAIGNVSSPHDMIEKLSSIRFTSSFKGSFTGSSKASGGSKVTGGSEFACSSNLTGGSTNQCEYSENALIDDLKQIANAWQSFIDRTPTGSRTFTEFKYHIARSQKGKPHDSGVRLSTVHGTQGREYRSVAIVGFNEGQFPDFRAQTKQQLQDELRIFYVALTRASRVLLISRSTQRKTEWTCYPTKQSRFMEYIYPVL